MIKKINEGEDIKFRIQLLDNDDKLLNYNRFDKYIIIAYTTNEKEGIEYDRSDMNDFVLSITSKDLAKLKKGQLKLKYIIDIIDNDYEDGCYTKVGIIQTRFFIDGKDENNCGCKCCKR